MYLLKYFKEYFFEADLDLPHEAISPWPYCTDRLTKLPAELLIHICILLSPVDLVCLSLCKHRLHTLFKTYYRFPTLRDDKLAILIRLEKDHPGYFAGHICRVVMNGSEMVAVRNLLSSPHA